jgi:hypothetical protein
MLGRAADGPASPFAYSACAPRIDMTDANLFDLLFIALLAVPGDLPAGEYPDGLRDAAIRFAVAAEMCVPEASWQGWNFPAARRWVRENLYVLGLPHESELERMPPAWVVASMLEHNQRFQERCNFWWYVRPDCRDLIGVAKAENTELYEAWRLLSAAHCERGIRRRMHLGQFRDSYPNYFLAPGSMPAFPYWRLPRD